MILGIVVIVAVIAVMAVAIAFALERRHCPGCSKRAVALHEWLEPLRRNQKRVGVYQCLNCHAVWRSFNGRDMISLEAYQAGADEPFPEAKVVREDRT
jgi:hypothetical protein